MKKLMLILFIFLGVAACKVNPFTGKKTLNFYPNSQIFPMSFNQYSQFLGENEVLTETEESRMITRVGQRISSAAERWLNANGYAGYLKDYRWEYNLVKDTLANAWCMPGGKIVFYTGILPIAQSETGVAVVMGHEVAHALADHGAQRMSASTLQALGAVAGNVAINDPQARNTFNMAYGVGSTVGVMLPFSRSHETEADRIGLQTNNSRKDFPNSCLLSLKKKRQDFTRHARYCMSHKNCVTNGEVFSSFITYFFQLTGFSRYFPYLVRVCPS